MLNGDSQRFEGQLPLPIVLDHAGNGHDGNEYRETRWTAAMPAPGVGCMIYLLWL
jgi:hypothetical protein